jgi:hypothetical protein
MTCTEVSLPRFPFNASGDLVDPQNQWTDKGPDTDYSERRDLAVNPLERLTQLLHSNDRLMAALASSRERIASARAYLDAPDCNRRFAEAHLDRARARHSSILARLRANRIEALEILGGYPNE